MHVIQRWCRWGMLLVAGFGVLGGSLLAHPYHVSSSRIDYNAETGGLEISIKLFTEDFEQVIEIEEGVLLNLGTDREVEGADAVVARYLLRHFKISLEGQTVQLKYLGKEVSIDDTWCYLEVAGVDRPSQIGVFDDLMLPHIETQTNVVRARVGKEEKDALLQMGHLEETLGF